MYISFDSSAKRMLSADVSKISASATESHLGVISEVFSILRSQNIPLSKSAIYAFVIISPIFWGRPWVRLGTDRTRDLGLRILVDCLKRMA